jgi:hypothetical protein
MMPNACSRLGRIIGVLLLAVGLGGCSAVKLGYNNLQDVAYWWLDGYLDFTDEQTVRVRDDLARLHQWHRATELPRYAQLLQKMEQLAPGTITPAQACGLFDDVRERLNAVAEQAEPAVVSTALALTPDQLQHLRSRYERNNKEFRREWLEATAAERKDRRLKQILERSEMVYGTLGDGPRNAIRAELERSVFDAQRIYDERVRRQADLLQTLRSLQVRGVTIAQARTLMRGYFERAQLSPDPAWRSYQQSLTDESCRTLAAGHNATTAEQRQTAVRRLRAYQRDLAELTAQQP